ncbi:diacylglycerol/lipid kinase family protein [Muriicola marianensis]|uniref:Lipid kinase n=1 Tax=Muriicola marianensis TaxID=1324801 RepID=A0ABQ1QSP2_9FLAO|nr:diacylglycerol kinase family protein [Muriicola marianensis]GGD40272.1 lipid kinase [Muriicola marianensis]
MKLVFIINNKNNRLRKVLPGLMDYFQQQYPARVAFQFTERRKHATELAKNAVEIGCEYLVAAGGDGTLNEVVNGLLLSERSAEEYPVLGLLPFGSANDFARTAGMTSSWEDLNKGIQSGSARPVDLGRITLQNTKEVRYFINISGIGLGPEVVQHMERTRPVLGSSFHYFKSILSGFLSYRKKKVICQSPSWKWEGKLLQMAVANGRYFGNAICVAPKASLSDGQFRVVIFGDLSIWDYIKNLSKLKRGVRIVHPEVSYHSAKELRLESPDSCGIEADGEYVGHLPASISILPGGVRLLMPPRRN